MFEQNDFLTVLRKIELYLQPSNYSKKIGIHHAAHHGHSLEFAGYQEYIVGDDLKNLDWKLFARTDRYYIKQRDSHTFATTLILLDDSSSMSFSSKEAIISKFKGALLLAFGLGYILHRQGDAFSFHALFSKGEPSKPRSSKKAFRHLVKVLQKMNNQGPVGKTELTYHELQPMSIDHLFLISDFLVSEECLKNWFMMSKLIAKEVTFFHLIDPEEDNPPFQKIVRDIENPNNYRFLKQKDWESYKSKFGIFKKNLYQCCLQHKFSYHTLNTYFPIEESIRKILSTLKH